MTDAAVHVDENTLVVRGRGRKVGRMPSSVQVQPVSSARTRADIGRDQMLYQPLCTFRILGLLRTDVSKGLCGYWSVFRIHQTPSRDDLLISA